MFRLLIFHDAAQQVGLTVFQADFVLDLALTDDGLADAADVLLAGDGGNVHRDLQRDLAVGVDPRGDINVDADIEILELRVDQRVDAHAADSGLEGSGRDRDAVTDLERSFLAIQGADLRILNQLGVAVAHQQREIGRRNGDLEILGREIAQSVQINAVVGGSCGRGSGCCRGCSGCRGCIDVVLQLNGRAGRWIQTQGSRSVFADLHDGDVNHDFGASFIEVFDQFLGESDLIWCSADHQGILRE